MTNFAAPVTHIKPVSSKPENKAVESRKSFGNVMFGFGLVFAGLLFAVTGLVALKNGTMIHGSFRVRPPLTGLEAVVGGLFMAVFGTCWLWTCFRTIK
jgi:hypothetical protein